MYDLQTVCQEAYTANMTTRTDKRRAASEDTKRQLLDAARTVLASADFGRFSLESVARQAGVSRLTIYYQFGSKRGLLEALYDDLAVRGDLLLLPRVFTQRDPVEALRNFVTLFCGFWASDPDLIRKVRAAAALDSEFESVIQRDEWRRNGLKVLITRIVAQQSPTLTDDPEKLIDVSCALTSFETFDGLSRAGWDQDEITQMVGRLIFELLKIKSNE